MTSTYLLTLRPLNVKRFSNFFDLYDFTMSVFNDIIRSVNADVLAFRFSDDPYYHIHAVISVSGRIRYDLVHKIVPKGFHVHLAPLRKKSDVERAKKYVLRHRPAHYVSVSEDVTFINRDGNNTREVLDMSDLEERIEKLERAVEKLTGIVEKLANGKSSETESKTEIQSVEIRAGAMTVIVQESRKGVALRIRFRSFVKANSKGEYYICLLYTSPSPRDLSTSRMPSSA